MKIPAPEGHVVHFEIAPRTMIWIIALLAGLWLIYQLWVVVLILVVALVVVGMFNPVIESLEARGLKRMHALTLLILALSLGTALLIFLTAPPLLDQLAQIIHDLPGQRV
ncbi:MAG: AI-2E family transporter, partial [Elusimicrobia bacterium]|nr:AI-2E family transporter [Elusimicrobiota bacterium]